jgi:hypothetical protein
LIFAAQIFDPEVSSYGSDSFIVFFSQSRVFFSNQPRHGKHMIELRFAARQKVFLRLSLILRLAQLFASGLV